ncbi:MAG: hypothetical protein ABJN35_03875 [Erythrobacter sp.]
MFLRIFSAVALVAGLAACGSDAETIDRPVVECAIGPGSDFAEVCSLERLASAEFVIHHPDGGFRRFSLTDDDTAPIGVADGAEPVNFQTHEDSDIWEFGLTVDRYRLDKNLIAAAANE